MIVVVDASLVAGVFLPMPHSEAAAEKLRAWAEAGVETVAPALLEYEIVNLLGRTVARGQASAGEADFGPVLLTHLKIRSMPPTAALHAKALTWAERLRLPGTHQAQYLALAEELRADLWTADPILAAAAGEAGAAWVKCLVAPCK